MKQYDYRLELFRDDLTPVGKVTLTPDWTSALEWTLFLAIRRGRRPQVMRVGPHLITPVWDPQAGEPYIAGLRVVLLEDGRWEAFSTGISADYFKDPAQEASSLFVQRGLLQPGEFIRFRVSAISSGPDSHAVQPGPVGLRVAEIPQPIPLSKKSLAQMTGEAVNFGDHHAADMPVFLPEHVLGEALALSAAAEGANEIGGVLIGKLHRDTRSPEIMSEVTAQVFADYTHSQIDRLTFTKETWTAVKHEVDLRKRDEIMLGWWHFHGYLRERSKQCENCQGRLAASPVFMSRQDVFFHRTVFFRPWGMALVVGDSPCRGLEYALYGWRSGMVVPRAFRILRGTANENRRVASPIS
jgi:hypothetical protein